jgi:hypothetical protein
LPLAAFWLLTANRESRVDIIHNLLLGFGLALTPLTSSAIMLMFFSGMKLGPRGLVEGTVEARSATPGHSDSVSL